MTVSADGTASDDASASTPILDLSIEKAHDSKPLHCRGLAKVKQVMLLLLPES